MDNELKKAPVECESTKTQVEIDKKNCNTAELEMQVITASLALGSVIRRTGVPYKFSLLISEGGYVASARTEDCNYPFMADCASVERKDYGEQLTRMLRNIKMITDMIEVIA